MDRPIDTSRVVMQTGEEAEAFRPPGEDVEDDIDRSGSESSGDENKERGNWGRQLDFLLTAVGYCVGLGNIWRFPYLCMRNGGGAFLIPYFLFLAIGGVPLYFLEVSIAQFSSRSALTVWYMCPLLKGLGWGMFLISGYCCFYYQIIISWGLYYLGNSFQSPLPWASCDNAWNTDFCYKRGVNVSTLNVTLGVNMTNMDPGIGYDAMEEVGNASFMSPRRMVMTPSEEFWQYNTLEMTDGIENFGGIRWQLVVCHLAGWVVNLLCVIKGVKSVGKVVYVTATVPYIFLIILLVRGCTLPGSLTGIMYYLTPDFDKLLEFRVWVEACMQIFYTLGPAWGGVITMGSYNKFHHNMYREALLVPIICCFTSFFAGFVTFSVVGFMAEEAGVAVEDVITSGPGLAFIAYPEALAQMPFAPVWSVMFFLMLFTVGLDSMFTMFETLVSGMVDLFPKTFHNKKLQVVLGMGAIFILAGFLFCTRGGIYYFQIFDWYSGAFAVMVYGVLECVAVIYIYGGKRYFYDLQMMMGHRPCLGWLVLCGGVTPISLLVCLGYSIASFSAPSYGEYTYPLWARAFGWCLAVSGVVPVICCGIHQLATTKGSIVQRLKKSIVPIASWGPAVEKYRNDYKYAQEPGEKAGNGVNIAMMKC